MIVDIPYPRIDPVFLAIGPVQLRWYGLMYLLSFVISYFVLRRFARYRQLNLSSDDLYDLLFYLIIGVFVGGRLGYVLFYDLPTYMQNPLLVFAIWQGGMSFHGGFIGVSIGAWFACRSKGWNFWEIADLACVAVPIGLGLGRIGNFINGELYGRETTVPWAMVFPDGGPEPRHPSQLYEALLEGVLLFLIVRWIYKKHLYRGTVFWAMVGFYGLFRFMVEFVREPDSQIGFDLGPFTRGQVFTFPMFVAGMTFMVIYARRSVPSGSHPSRKSQTG